MTQDSSTSDSITLSAQAEKQILKILQKEPKGTVLRISVSGGGCSGFSYEYNLVQESKANDDMALGEEQDIVLIDSLSQEFMLGSEIDFIDDLSGQSFAIKNPNAVASCGCGSSFAV